MIASENDFMTGSLLPYAAPVCQLSAIMISDIMLRRRCTPTESLKDTLKQWADGNREVMS